MERPRTYQESTPKFVPVINDEEKSQIKNSLDKIEKRIGQFQAGDAKVREVEQKMALQPDERRFLNDVVRGSYEGLSYPDLSSRKVQMSMLTQLRTSKKELTEDIKKELNGVKDELDAMLQQSKSFEATLAQPKTEGSQTTVDTAGKSPHSVKKATEVLQIVEPLRNKDSLSSEDLDKLVKLGEEGVISQTLRLAHLADNLNKTRLKLEDFERGIELSQKARAILLQARPVPEKLRTAVGAYKDAVDELIKANDALWEATKKYEEAESAANAWFLEPEEKKNRDDTLRKAREALKRVEQDLAVKVADVRKKKEALTKVLKEVALIISPEKIRQKIEENKNKIERLNNIPASDKEEEAQTLAIAKSNLQLYQDLENVLLRYQIDVEGDVLRQEEAAKVTKEFRDVQKSLRFWDEGFMNSAAIDSLRVALKSREEQTPTISPEEDEEVLFEILEDTSALEGIDKTFSGIVGLESSKRDNDATLQNCYNVTWLLAWTVILLPLAGLIAGLAYLAYGPKGTESASDELKKLLEGMKMPMKKLEEEVVEPNIEFSEYDEGSQYEDEK